MIKAVFIFCKKNISIKVEHNQNFSFRKIRKKKDAASAAASHFLSPNFPYCPFSVTTAPEAE